MRLYSLYGLLLVMIILLSGCAFREQSVSQPPIQPRQVQPRETEVTLEQQLKGVEFGLLIAAGDATHPILSDDFLTAAFKQHRSTFEELRQMIVSDSGLTRVGDDWTNPRNPTEIGVTPERIAEYRRLFASIGCPEGFAADSNRSRIDFISGAQGLGISGSSKGYSYCENIPANIVTDTAAGPVTPTNGDWLVFRPIEGHWYIYFESH